MHRVILLLILLTAISCNRGEEAANDDTIAPATPPVSTGTGDEDTVITQTVEIGEERSPNEGGALIDESPATATSERGAGAPPTTTTQ